jgi:hypothetical protein
VIQRRFYDLAAFIATLFSDAGKCRAAPETPDKKGLVNLIWIPIVKRDGA